MPTTTVSSLIDRAKATADMRDNFVTPAQWVTWATQERLALDLFLARSGWTLPLTDFNITVAGTEAGAYNVNPTGGVLAIVCVLQYDTSGRMRLLKHEDSVSFLRRTPGYTGSSGHAASYRAISSGDGLILNMYPEPTAGETYRVVYLPHPKALVVSGPVGWQEASVTYPMGWEERIVLGMARRALMKEESDFKAVDQEIALWESRIEEACWNKVLSSAPSVRNSDSLNYAWSDRFSVPPFGLWTWV